MFKLGPKDRRLFTAREHVYSMVNELMHKATRVGATTNYLAHAAYARKNILLVGATIKICTKIVKEAVGLIDFDIESEFIASNMECYIFKELCSDTPTLKSDLKVYPLDSNQCAYREKGDKETTYCEHYERCRVVKLLNIDLSKVRIISVTHAKFAAYRLAYENWSETKDYRKNKVVPIQVQIYLKLLEWADIVFYDECHHLEQTDIVSKPIYRYNTPINYENLRQYAFPDSEGNARFPLIADIVEYFIKLMEHPLILETRDKVIDKASKDRYWTEHLCDTVQNPEKLVFIDKEGKPYHDPTSGLLEFYSVMISLIQFIGDDNHTPGTTEDMLALYDIATIVTAEYIALNATRKDGNISVDLLVNDDSKRKNTAKILYDFRNAKKKILMTSATIGEHDYSQYLGKRYLQTFWGGSGDPMNTNANQLILCDSKTYDMKNKKYGLRNNLEAVAKDMIRFMEVYGDDVIIFAVSSMWALRLENKFTKLGHPHSVDYYGSDNSIGVSSENRITLHLLMGELPSNACDPMTPYNDVSKRMRLNLVHERTNQAMGRGKDPNGIVPSLAVFFGVREDKVRAMATWGSNRKVTIEDGKVHVTCDQYIPMPHIKECKNIEEMLEEALKFKSPRKCEVAAPLNENSVCKEEHVFDNMYSISEDGKLDKDDKSLTILPKNNQMQEDFYTLNKYVVIVIDHIFPIDSPMGSSDYMTVTRYLYLNKIIGRHDIFDQMNDEGEFERQNRNLNPEIEEVDINILINELKVCMLTTDNKVGCMFFDIKGGAINNKSAIAKQNKNIICNFLDSLNISYYAEEERYSFRVWVFFTEKIEARIARDFGKAVLEELSIEEGVEVYPKTCRNNKNSKGDFVKLPRIDISQMKSSQDALQSTNSGQPIC